jgi:hypothetical protein
MPTLPSSTVYVETAGAGGFGGGGMAIRNDGTVISSGAPGTATNIMTIGGSGSAYMAVKARGRPVFPLAAMPRTVATGQRAYFRLRAVGALPMSYQWSFQGTNLPAATNSVLVVTNVQQSDAGPYILTVSNALGVTTSPPMLLNIERPTLAIQVTTTNTVIVSWPGPSTGFTLQVNTNLSSGNWQLPTETIINTGAARFIIVDPPIANRFYRLVYQ